jgi:predicted HicB family RNase H-like nuclease
MRARDGSQKRALNMEQEEKKSVNINIEVPDDIHKRIKILSAMQGIAIKELIITALEESVNNDKK